MKSLLNTLLLVTAMLTLTACLGPGYRTTNMNGHKRVYHVDEEGNKRLIYEVDKTGKTIGHVKDDPQYKQHMAQIAHQQKQQEAALEKQKELEQAEKRSATDPIYVYLEKIKNGPGHTSKDPKKQKQIEKTVNNIEARIKKELSSHKLIKLTDNTNKADIIVDITVDMKKKTMVNRKTMKTGEVPMIVFTSNSENTAVKGIN